LTADPGGFFLSAHLSSFSEKMVIFWPSFEKLILKDFLKLLHVRAFRLNLISRRIDYKSKF
jgi:hypothetical protein